MPLDDVWAPGDEPLRERLLTLPPSPEEVLLELETALVSRAGAGLAMDPGVAWSIAALPRGVTVRSVVDGLWLTPRRFISRFEAHVGLKPKTFARIQRFQKALGLRQQGLDWSAVAAVARYSDQAHLIHDFREFTGTTPTAYQPPDSV